MCPLCNKSQELKISYVCNQKWYKHAGGVIHPIVRNFLVQLQLWISLSSTKYSDLRHIIKQRQEHASIIWRHMWTNYSMRWIFLQEFINSIYDVQYWNNSLLDQIGRFTKMSHHRPKLVLVIIRLLVCNIWCSHSVGESVVSHTLKFTWNLRIH